MCVCCTRGGGNVARSKRRERGERDRIRNEGGGQYSLSEFEFHNGAPLCVRLVKAQLQLSELAPLTLADPGHLWMTSLLPYPRLKRADFVGAPAARLDSGNVTEVTLFIGHANSMLELSQSLVRLLVFIRGFAFSERTIYYPPVEET